MGGKPDDLSRRFSTIQGLHPRVARTRTRRQQPSESPFQHIPFRIQPEDSLRNYFEAFDESGMGAMGLNGTLDEGLLEQSSSAGQLPELTRLSTPWQHIANTAADAAQDLVRLPGELKALCAAPIVSDPGSNAHCSAKRACAGSTTVSVSRLATVYKVRSSSEATAPAVAPTSPATSKTVPVLTANSVTRGAPTDRPVAT